MVKELGTKLLQPEGSLGPKAEKEYEFRVQKTSDTLLLFAHQRTEKTPGALEV